jgi:hypothetical protein
MNDPNRRLANTEHQTVLDKMELVISTRAAARTKYLETLNQLNGDI